MKFGVGLEYNIPQRIISGILALEGRGQFPGGQVLWLLSQQDFSEPLNPVAYHVHVDPDFHDQCLGMT